MNRQSEKKAARKETPSKTKRQELEDDAKEFPEGEKEFDMKHQSYSYIYASTACKRSRHRS